MKIKLIILTVIIGIVFMISGCEISSSNSIENVDSEINKENRTETSKDKEDKGDKVVNEPSSSNNEEENTPKDNGTKLGGKIIGNTQGNISNGGLADEADGWVYFISSSDGSRFTCNLYKMRIDGSEKTKLSDKLVYGYINVVDGWVYFTAIEIIGEETEFETSLWKIRIDGSESKKVAYGCKDVYITENYIFYSNGYEDITVYRMGHDGEDVTELTWGLSFIGLYDDWIFVDMMNTLQKFKIDGTEKIDLNEDISEIIIVDDWLYYSNYSDDGKIYRMKVNGSEKIKISDAQGYSFNAYKGWLYYTNYSDDRKIYKMRLDGTENIKLSDEAGEYINIAGDWVFYKIYGGPNDGKLCRMRLDGSDWQLME